MLRTTAPAALGEGEAVFGQMLVNGSGALAQYLLERGSGDSLRRFVSTSR